MDDTVDETEETQGARVEFEGVKLKVENIEQIMLVVRDFLRDAGYIDFPEDLQDLLDEVDLILQVRAGGLFLGSDIACWGEQHERFLVDLAPYVQDGGMVSVYPDEEETQQPWRYSFDGASVLKSTAQFVWGDPTPLGAVA